jgi:hypothetical protein
MKILRILQFVVLICFINLAYGQELVINEFMTSNGSSIQDEDGDNEDWIEIYNNATYPINLNGFYLSDRVNNPQRWAFPNVILQPNSYLIVFASGKNRRNPNRELHTNFSLSSSGEDIVLSNSQRIIQHIPSVIVPRDWSYGFQRDASEPYVFFPRPTPGSSNIGGQPEIPEKFEIYFSIKGGIYPSLEQKLELSTNDTQFKIRYTIDGSKPKHNSTLYTEPIVLDKSKLSTSRLSEEEISKPEYYNPPKEKDVKKTIVIRAGVFDEYERLMSDIITQTYFIETIDEYYQKIPIVSICADHNDLINHNIGIFVRGVNYIPNSDWWTGNFQMRGSEWERDASLEYYEYDTVGFSQNIGLRTHGGLSRNFVQRGLRFYARPQYGKAEFEFPIYKDYEHTTFERLVAKPFRSSWSHAGVQDYITDMLALDLGLDATNSRPINLYINGEYWGIYYLTERIDTRFLAYKHNVRRNDITIIEHWKGDVGDGNGADFEELIQFVEDNELSSEDNYQWINDRVDIDNFIDYQIFEIYIANVDWPANNMRMWKTNHPGSKWQWIYFDGDAAINGYHYDGFSAAKGIKVKHALTSERAGIMFVKLLKNETFKAKYLKRWEEILDTFFTFERTSKYLTEIKNAIEPSIQSQSTRFGIPANQERWAEDMNTIGTFFNKRHCKVTELMEEHYGVDLSRFCNDEDNILLDNINLYPNPNKGTFEVVFDADNFSKSDIIITNSLGQQIDKSYYFITVGDNFINVKSNNLTPGIYIVYLHSKKHKKGLKFVVMD